MPPLRRLILLAALLSPAAAQAADITIHRAPRPIVRVSGPTNPGDDQQFLVATQGLRNALVVFSGPGGSLRAGLEIGRTIRARRFSTAVEDGQMCASACALAWLAGTERFMWPGSRIGFHSAFTRGEGGVETSSIGNALVGAYVTQLGLPEQAVVFVTAARPQGILLINAARAAAVGIPVAMMSGGLPRPSLEPRPPLVTTAQAQPAAEPAARPPAAEPPPAPPRPPAPLAPNGRLEGAVRQGFAELRGRRIPLPPGRWIEAYSSESLGGSAHRPFVQAELLLVQSDAAGVSGWVLASMQDFRGATFVGDWGPSDVCSDAAPAFQRRTAAFTDRHHDCASVAPLEVAPEKDTGPLWLRVNMLAKELPGTVPSWIGRAAFRHARNDYAMTLRYDFDVGRLPRPDGRALPAGAPARDRPEDEPLARLARWSESSADTIRRGLNRRLVSALPAP